MGVEVRCPSGVGAFVDLPPRQRIGSVPYATQTRGLFVTNSKLVGVGTNDPQRLLHVKSGGSGVTPNSNAGLVVERDNSTFINILSPSDDQIGVLFGNPNTGSAGGGVVYNSGATPSGLQFRTGGNLTRMSVDGAGHVGVGTTAPERLLHVKDGEAGVTPNSNARLVVERDNSTFINILSPGEDQIGILFGNPDTGSAGGGVIYNSGATPSGLQFRTGGNVTRMVIESGGNVGIGTSNPSAKLHVTGSAGDSTVRLPGSSIGSAEIADEPGVARGYDGPLRAFDPGDGWVTLTEQTLDHPTSGFVIIIGTTELSNSTLGSPTVTVGLTNQSSPAPGASYETTIPGIGAKTTTTVQSFRSVSGSGSLTFRLMAMTNGDALAENSAVTMMFVPTAYGDTEF